MSKPTTVPNVTPTDFSSPNAFSPAEHSSAAERTAETTKPEDVLFTFPPLTKERLEALGNGSDSDDNAVAEDTRAKRASLPNDDRGAEDTRAEQDSLPSNTPETPRTTAARKESEKGGGCCPC